MIDIALLTAVFIVGFNGSLHCVGMCGPIVGILGMNTEANSRGKKIGTAICYNLGRITTYMFLGVIAMILSIAMKDLKPLQLIVRYFAGIVMLFVALQLIGFPQFLAFIEKPLHKLSRPISKLTRKFFPIKTFFGAYTAGLAWGLLPCGMVYAAFAMSLGAKSLFGAPLTMLIFGLGTLPMMLTLSISGNFFGGLFSSPNVRRIAGVLVLSMTAFYMGSMLMSDLGKGGGMMDHSNMNHGAMSNANMDHSTMNHAEMGNANMDHSTMNHAEMGNTNMDHSNMNHSTMNDAEMGNANMDYSSMNHADMEGTNRKQTDHTEMKPTKEMNH